MQNLLQHQIENGLACGVAILRCSGVRKIFVVHWSAFPLSVIQHQALPVPHIHFTFGPRTIRGSCCKPCFEFLNEPPQRPGPTLKSGRFTRQIVCECFYFCTIESRSSLLIGSCGVFPKSHRYPLHLLVSYNGQKLVRKYVDDSGLAMILLPNLVLPNYPCIDPPFLQLDAKAWR